MSNEEFQKLYNQLNPAQKEAVDSVEGPVMVVAGPGTGKTRILTLRIANILRVTDVDPTAILALTFTEAAAASMRRRLVEIIGNAAYAVNIQTFHGFANDVIRSYPEEFPSIIGSQNITEVGQLQILEEIIRKLNLKELRPFNEPLYHIRSILSSIDGLKREGVRSEEFERIVKKEQEKFTKTPDLYHEKGVHKGKMKGKYIKEEKRLKKNEELALIYKAYQEELQRKKFYDYSDMVMELLVAFGANDNLLRYLQEEYHYFLIDEHQDTNRAQNKIVELLANFHQNPNVFVVGDQKQAIFRFQGASLENFNYFKRLYPESKIVVLADNYRSPQTILDSAYSLLFYDEALRARKKTDKEEGVFLHEFSSEEVENYFLARSIKEKLEAGEPPEEIAVLYRDNRDASPVARTLEKYEIPFSIKSDPQILEDNDTRKLLLILETVEEFGSSEKILEAMHADFWEIDPLDIYKIAEKNKDDGFLADLISSKEKLIDLKLKAPEKVRDFYRILSDLKKGSKNKHLTEFFEDVLKKTGFLAHILSSPNSAEKLEKIKTVFSQAKILTQSRREAGLEDLLRYFKTLKDHNIQLKKKNTLGRLKRVQLMTAHGAKGLEFKYVYIVGAYDGHWGNKKQPKMLILPSRVYSLTGQDLPDSDNTDDERRLFYVALTRAKSSVFISYAKMNDEGKERIPSRFIQEIKPEFVKKAEVARYEENFFSEQGKILLPAGQGNFNIQDKDYIKSLFFKRGLSVTALNNYLECPWKYFYVNLLLIPRAKSKSQIYGTAVHEALSDFFRSGGEGKDFLLERFRGHLKKTSLVKEELEDTLKKGEKALSGYYDFYKEKWCRDVLTELNVKGIFLVPEVRIQGKIDKLEKLGKDNEVNVVDYKTGKPKSRNEIEGKTRFSEGDIKRQLVFYNLLLDNYLEGRYKMVSGDIDFVEPNERGYYKKENFVISREEVKELAELIKKTAAEIVNLEFWERRCENEKCEYCYLRDMM